MTEPPVVQDIKPLLEKIRKAEDGINSVILGKETLVREFITGLLARGHILLEGLPGLGKTQMVRTLAMLCDLVTNRIQFTPDLMPLDITGSYILSDVEGKRDYVFHAGPLFGNLILADEINRASPKTQSAMLEAMQERRVTVLGHTHVLPEPFLVLATQNPIELEGTYPLPEAQLDRFLFKLMVGDVPAAVLARIVMERGNGDLPNLTPVINKAELLAAMGMVSRVLLSQQVASYIARLVKSTHRAEDGVTGRLVKYGASPRAALSISMASRARAFLDGRVTVGFEDVKAVASATLRHRIILDYSARLEGVSTDDVIQKVLTSVPEIERPVPPTVVERLT